MTKKMKNSKRNKKLLFATTAAALMGAGGILPSVDLPTNQAMTVEAAEDAANPAWTANTVPEVEQELHQQNAPATNNYHIRWGDTLGALSLATGIPVDELAAQNNIENPHLIYAGDLLTPYPVMDQGAEAPTAPVEEADAAPEETPAVEEPVAEEPAQEEAVVEEAPAEEEPDETAEVEAPVEQPAAEEEPVEEVFETTPAEPVEPMETTDETPEAIVLLPEEPEEEIVEEVVPEPEEIEALEVVDVETTEEVVDPNDRVVSTQSAAVVADPASHKTPSEEFVRPAQGYVSSEYGYRIHPITGVRRLHAGLDIAGSGSIVAAQSGTVTRTSYSNGWGNYLVIDHGDGLQTLYAHLQDGSMTVSQGDTVSQGQTIGTMGQTGSATGVHLHFEVYVNGVQVDPAPYL